MSWDLVVGVFAMLPALLAGPLPLLLLLLLPCCSHHRESVSLCAWLLLYRHLVL
jgi:hypothetical protein